MAANREVSRLAECVEALVTEVEATTSAELVVVVAGRSSTYRWVPVWSAIVAGFAATAFFCWSPWVFDDRLLPVDAGLVAGFVGAVVAYNDRARHWLAGRREPARAVGLGADAAFWQEAVHATRGRTGVLIYVSVLERIVTVRADSAILASVPGADWLRVVGGVEAAGVAPEPFAAAFRALGEVLARHLPRAHDDVNESPDAPRIRS